MYLTPRPYLLAGFTAAAIVAAIPTVTGPIVHLAGSRSADIRLAAADSVIVSRLRTLRAVETRALASVIENATTTVIPGLARHSRATTEGRTVPSTTTSPPDGTSVGTPAAATDTIARQPDIAQHATSTNAAEAITASDLYPLIGDLAATGFDLLGTPFGIITALSFAGDLAISDLGAGALQDIPADVTNSLEFGIGSQLNLLSADLNILTNELNHLSGITNPAPPSDTQSGSGTGTVGTSTSIPAAAPARTTNGTVDPTAIGSLIGDAAILGLDAVATPFQLTASLTGALSAAASDLGAGQVQFAEQDFTTALRGGFVEAEGRLSSDLEAIQATLARLTGTSLAQADTASSSQPRLTDASPRPVVSSRPTPSAPGAKPVSANRHHTTGHNPGTPGVAATDTSTASQRTPSASKTANAPTKQSAETATNTTPAKSSPTKVGNGAAGTNTPRHAAPGNQHAPGPKHRKH